MARVLLDAGHGGSDSGAVGNGLKEKDINLVETLSCITSFALDTATVTSFESLICKSLGAEAFNFTIPSSDSYPSLATI